jgi:CheY-like chemotaxis protein
MTPLSNQHYKVLVVDDDPSVLATYRRLLSRSGYTTATVADPREILADHSLLDGVDLLLLDYKMPGIDGITLLAELRRREFQGHCILISGFVDDGVRSQASNLGVNQVMNKPVDICRLRGALKELLPVTGAAPLQASSQPA